MERESGRTKVERGGWIYLYVGKRERGKESRREGEREGERERE